MSSGAQLQFSRYLRNLVGLATYLNISNRDNSSILKAKNFYEDLNIETGNEDINYKVYELLENMVSLNKLVIDMNSDKVEQFYDDLLVDWFQKNSSDWTKTVKEIGKNPKDEKSNFEASTSSESTSQTQVSRSKYEKHEHNGSEK